MSNLSHLTYCGLPGIGRVPVGMHACHFYRDREQLVAALVPYAIAGLRVNERCLLVGAPPLPARELLDAMRGTWDGVDDAIEAGAVRVVDFDQWYPSTGRLKGLEVLSLWLEEEERALAEGCDGLRISGITSFLAPGDWAALTKCEHAVTAGMQGRRIVALCSYALAQCDDRRIGDIMQAHHCALERLDIFWQVVPRPGWALPEEDGGRA